MNPERWQQVRALLGAAFDRNDAERAAFLDEACAGDDALRLEVESLLAADRDAPDYTGPAMGPGLPEAKALTMGQRLGPYEIQELLGAGGMGEVYRAHDTRLRRDVAIKVLPRSLSRDPDRLRRFEQEARAAGTLNHPNILAVHDVGIQDGTTYVVTELLEGETLRARLSGAALPLRKAIDYGAQVARGLAAAHQKEVVHRDLKPENLFVTTDGRVKILDFGLAKLASVTPQATEPGTLLGTVGYMSPEQVRGEAATARSDIFSLGATLYEMLTGRRAFEGETAAETMAAILKAEPREISETHRNVPASLERIVRRCVEKVPQERFQSAGDLAFGLETLAPLSESSPPLVAAPFTRRQRIRTLWAVLAGLAVAAFTFALGLRMAEHPVPSFKQLTFRRGTVSAARFSPDGNSVLYSAAWDGGTDDVFAMRLDGAESRSLGLPGTRLLATAPGEMAVLRRTGRESGMLARVPLEGGVPREVRDDVRDADWTADATRFAVVRAVGGRIQLEFPIGRVVYETSGTIDSARVSPRGDRVAFIDQTMLGNAHGSVVSVDLEGRRQTLSAGWSTAGGLAWAPAGDEVWFTATKVGLSRSLHAVSLSGRYRLVSRAPSSMILHDVSRTGRVLLSHEHPRGDAFAHLVGHADEKDLSWHDFTHASDLSAQGLLFTSEGESGGALYEVYLRRGLDSPPVRLGHGHATELSPDGAFALVILPTTPPQLRVIPTGPGEPRTLPPEEGIVEYHWAWWMPDGKRILFLANKTNRPSRLFLQSLAGGPPRPFAPEGVTAYRHKPISPDGRFVAALAPGDPVPRFLLYPVEGGEPRPLAGLAPDDLPIRWAADGGSLFVRAPGVDPHRVRLDRVDLAGVRSHWKDVAPADPTGVESIGDVLLSPDGLSVVFAVRRMLSELFVVDGLK